MLFPEVEAQRSQEVGTEVLLLLCCCSHRRGPEVSQFLEGECGVAVAVAVAAVLLFPEVRTCVGSQR